MTMTGIGSSLTGMSVSTPMGRGSSNPYDSGGLDVNQRGGVGGGGGGSSNDRERLMQPATSHGRSSHGGHSYHAPGSSGNGLSYNAPAGAVPTTGLGGHILTQGGVGQSLGARYRSDAAASGQNDTGGGRAGGGQSQSGVSLSVTALRYKDRGDRSERDKLADSSTYGTRGVSTTTTTTNSNSQFGGPFNQSAYGRSSQGAAAAQASSSMRSQQSQSQQNAQQQAQQQQQQQANQAAAAQNRYATNPLAAPQGGGGARWTGLSGLSLRGAAAR